MGSFQRWVRPDGAKDNYSTDKQNLSGGLEHELIQQGDVPLQSALPSTFTSSSYIAKNDETAAIKIIPAMIPFAINDQWVLLARDAQEATVGQVMVRGDKVKLRVDPAITIDEYETLYVIPLTGLISNVDGGGTNKRIGVCLTKDADKDVIGAGGTLPAGTYADMIWNPISL